MWDVTHISLCIVDKIRISTHTSRVGCDDCAGFVTYVLRNFYSHIPCGMWHYTRLIGKPTRTFLLTHPVWDVTLFTHLVMMNIIISTHTSRVGCDSTTAAKKETAKISTHTSRVGCDEGYLGGLWDRNISTHTSRVGCDQVQRLWQIQL